MEPNIFIVFSCYSCFGPGEIKGAFTTVELAEEYVKKLNKVSNRETKITIVPLVTDSCVNHIVTKIYYAYISANTGQVFRKFEAQGIIEADVDGKAEEGAESFLGMSTRHMPHAIELAHAARDRWLQEEADKRAAALEKNLGKKGIYL